MKILTGKETEYKNLRDSDSEPDTKGVFVYAELWAELMEKKIEHSNDVMKAIAENAAKLSFYADPCEGISGFICNSALNILAQYWEYGEYLKSWNDERIQFERRIMKPSRAIIVGKEKSTMNIRAQYRGKHVHALPANKHLDGTWVYGFLESEDYIAVTYKNGDMAEKLIDKSTVGMCCGKKDKTGTDIFEGDILENDKGQRFEVRYGTYIMYCPVDNCMMENVGFYTVAEGIYEDMPLGPTEEYAKVIGNIHDNPDLKVDEKYRCPLAL